MRNSHAESALGIMLYVVIATLLTHLFGLFAGLALALFWLVIGLIHILLPQNTMDDGTVNG